MTASDCGVPAHTKEMMCITGGYCITVCEEHWGDCNEAYSDGCEVAIKDRVYCDGDPRIGESVAPTVSFFSNDQGVGPGHFDSSRFARGLDDQIPLLEACYKELLTRMPGLHGLILSRFTLDQSGKNVGVQIVSNSAANKDLEVCVAKAAANVHFDHGPEAGSITYLYRVAFARGSAGDPQ